MTDWTAELRTQREEKDEFFAENPRSPIPDDKRDSFSDLRYFDIKSKYRFTLPLNENDQHDTITVNTTHEGEQTYFQWGTFEFSLEDASHTLTAYKSDPDEDRLWVPFRDATNGEVTYSAGRYIDLVSPHDTENDKWILDFNSAYNPFCAYNDAYECPLIPRDNWLDVPVKAGEKKPQI
ncbi:MAG: DUF1684 domain-containing protein [Halobacteriaceae archaeon]